MPTDRVVSVSGTERGQSDDDRFCSERADERHSDSWHEGDACLFCGRLAPVERMCSTHPDRLAVSENDMRTRAMCRECVDERADRLTHG